MGEGALVAEGVGGVDVKVGAWVFCSVGVGVIAVGRGVGVSEGTRVSVGCLVRVGASVLVLVRVGEGVMLGTAVGGAPSTVKRPEVFQEEPMNICTSYSPCLQR